MPNEPLSKPGQESGGVLTARCDEDSCGRQGFQSSHLEATDVAKWRIIWDCAFIGGQNSEGTLDLRLEAPQNNRGFCKNARRSDRSEIRLPGIAVWELHSVNRVSMGAAVLQGAALRIWSWNCSY